MVWNTPCCSTPPTLRLAQKFTLALLVVMGVALAIRGVLDARRAIEHHVEGVRAAQRDLGLVMSAAVVRIWKNEGWESALAYLDEVEAQQGDTEIRWTWLEPQELEEYLPRVPAARVLELLRTLPPEAEVPVSRPDLPGYVVTYKPVRLRGLPLGAIEFTRSTADQEAWITRELRHTALTSLLVILVYALVASVLGRRLVGRPIQDLVALARRVGEGRFTIPATVRQADEIGTLASEMNRMSKSLQLAQETAAAERAERRENEQLLVHADRLASVGRLAASLTHDIGTPLNVIHGRAMMIAEGDVEPAETPEVAKKIAKQADRIAQMIRGLLDFARRSDVERRMTPLAALAAEADELVGPVARKAKVEIVLEDETPGLEAPMHRASMRQVVTNLVVNAIQAMPEGGKVTLRTGRYEGAPPDDPDGPAGEWGFVEVEDEGVGIPDADRGRIFEPFFTTKAEGEGTGLGLSVCDKIVRTHGGRLWVDSEEGRGTRITVHLPLTEETES